MAALSLKNISKIYKNGSVGVHDLSIEVLEGELMVLVGPSGSGKSTALRLIAGLENPTEGDVFIGGRLANDILPRDRDVAMVFQDYALYPHLNVEQNMGFGLKMRKLPVHEIRSRVKEASRMLGIEKLLGRRPKELSGGQRQRVALGRALVREPKVFLFDEPLSNLDVSLRVQLRREIKDIHRKLEATMVYVTHDQNEAMSIGQRIAVMNAGAIEQVGSPEELYRWPQTRFVAGFFGTPSMNFAECDIESNPDGLKIRYAEKSFVLRCAGNKQSDGLPRRIVLGFRPEDVSLEDKQAPNTITGCAQVLSLEATGAETIIFLENGRLMPVVRVLGYTDIKLGGEVTYSVPSEKLHFFDIGTGRRIKIY